MNEVSNKTLATLLVVAIVVSLGGTFVSLQRLSKYAGVPVVTGFGGSSGRVNVTITVDDTINATDDLIWFGEGSVDIGRLYAELWSNGSKMNWTNDTAWMPDPMYDTNEDFIIIENLGNIPVNVTVKTSKTASAFIGGSNPDYRYWTEDNETGSCLGSLEGNSSATTQFIGDGNIEQNVCSKLNSTTEVDTVKLYSHIRIPTDASGSKTDTLTFTSGPSAE